MSNQFIPGENLSPQDIYTQKLLDRFDNIIDQICNICHENQVTELLNQMKPLAKSNRHFNNLSDTIVCNSSYSYNNQYHNGINSLLSKLVREFDAEEQLVLVANMDIYGISYNDRTTDLLKYLMRKIIKQKLVNN